MEEPECDFDETTKAGYVRIRMRIPGIKPRRGGSRPEEGNAVFEGPFYGNENLSITLKILNKGGLDEDYQYQVNQLPGAIVPEKTQIKVEKNWVIMFLKKKDKERSWESYFRNGSLERE